MPAQAPETLAHRKVEAGAVPRDEFFALAKPEREKLVQVLERVAGRSSRSIGAEVERSVFLKPPDYVQPGIGVSRVDPDREVILVVAKHDVVARAVFLYEAGLEEQRLLFG